MDAEAIRTLLAELPQASLIRTPPGHAAILRSRVESAGADLEAVDAWILSVGGSIEVTQARELPPANRAGGGRTRLIPSERYYSVPRTVLEAS